MELACSITKDFTQLSKIILARTLVKFNHLLLTLPLLLYSQEMAIYSQSRNPKQRNPQFLKIHPPQYSKMEHQAPHFFKMQERVFLVLEATEFLLFALGKRKMKETVNNWLKTNKWKSTNQKAKVIMSTNNKWKYCSLLKPKNIKKMMGTWLKMYKSSCN